MRRFRYPFVFTLVVIGLTVGALAAYGRISTLSLAGAGPPPLAGVAADSVDTAPIYVPATAADYEQFAEQDSAWRAEHAPPLTLAELRARGDGRRGPREALQDRVYRLAQQGERGRAIAELEAWVASHPADREALLSLARLLAGAGRTEASVKRYRQLIALEERRP